MGIGVWTGGSLGGLPSFSSQMRFIGQLGMLLYSACGLFVFSGDAWVSGDGLTASYLHRMSFILVFAENPLPFILVLKHIS